MKSFFQWSKGLTLIELLLVITIVLIVSAVSTPFYSRFFLSNDVMNVNKQLVGSLRKAQIYAVMGKQNGNWGVNYSGGKITVFQGTSFLLRNPALDESFTVNSNITINGLTSVIFTKRTGLPDGTPTITLSAVNTSKTVSINSQGVVSQL
jgi:prepilin-type N-terminal cleavage/methylation domain-containing protein